MRHNLEEPSNSLFTAISEYLRDPKSFPPSPAGTTSHTADLFVRNKLPESYFLPKQEEIAGVTYHKKQICEKIWQLPFGETYKRRGVRIIRNDNHFQLTCSFPVTEAFPTSLWEMTNLNQVSHLTMSMQHFRQETRFTENVAKQFGFHPSMKLYVNLSSDPRVPKHEKNLPAVEKGHIGTTFFALEAKKQPEGESPARLEAIISTPKSLEQLQNPENLFYESNFDQQQFYKMPLDHDMLSMAGETVSILSQLVAYLEKNK